MENVLSSAEYLERAAMHDGLAEATADGQARQMHRAMAAEYRRRADEVCDGMTPLPGRGPVLEVAVSVGQPA